MELIKKIKDTEKKAKEIVEQARTQAAKVSEESRKSRLEKLAQAERDRKKAFETAVTVAEKQAAVEIEKLHADAKQKNQNLRDIVSRKIEPAVAKVVNHIKG